MVTAAITAGADSVMSSQSLKHQPIKIAAIDANWDSDKPAAFAPAVRSMRRRDAARSDDAPADPQ